MKQTSTNTSYKLFAENIIKSGAKKNFAKDKIMSCLLDSETFYNDILDLFCRLNTNKISSCDFADIVQTLDEKNTDKNRLKLISELYKYFYELMTQNKFDIPTSFLNLNFTEKNCLNNEIGKRLNYLLNYFKGLPNETIELNKSDSIEYRVFTDIQNEIICIIENIKELVESNVCNLSDIAIFVDKTESRQKVLDLLKAENLPVISSIYNEYYELFKFKIINYKKISDVLLKLNIQEFNADEIKNVSIPSQAQKEILYEELDEILKNLLYGSIENSSLIDKILAKQTSHKRTSIFESIFSLWKDFSEEETRIIVEEFSAIKTFYESYKNNCYSDAIEKIIKRFFKYFNEAKLTEIITGKLKSIKELQVLYDKIIKEKPDFDSFLKIIEWLAPTEEKNAITLMSITNKNKSNYKFVFIPCLTENNFPGSNPSYPYISNNSSEAVLSKLKEKSAEFTYLFESDEIHNTKRFYDFCSLLKATTDKIVLSTHNYESQKHVQPAKVLKLLLEKDSKNIIKKELHSTNTNIQKIQNIEFIDIQNDKVVISENDILKLSASSISTYQKCPRKYYFKHLLNLKEPSNFAASYGTIVHCVMENFNNNYIHTFTPQTVIELADLLFDAKKNPENAQKAKFKDLDIELIRETDELSIIEMKDNFHSAIEDLKMMGYFDKKPISVECEKSFSFTIPELKNIIFEGRIDAIINYKDGYKIIDYKTGKDKANSLSYAISDNGVNFRTEKGKDASDISVYQNRYDYQIPIYYLATLFDKNLEKYKNKITELGLLYIRPQNRDNGCKEDFIDAASIEAYKNKIITNLNELVIEKIKNETIFSSNSNWNCENCSYKFLCDEAVKDE